MDSGVIIILLALAASNLYAVAKSFKGVKISFNKEFFIIGFAPGLPLVVLLALLENH